MQIKNEHGQSVGEKVIQNGSDLAGKTGTQNTKIIEGSIKSKLESPDHQNLSNSDGQLSDSTKHWSTPKNVKGLAAQANMAATMVLNGELNIDVARTYSAIIRTVAQAVTNETNKARFLREMPDLEFEEEVFEIS